MPQLPDTQGELVAKSRIRLLVQNPFLSELVLRLRVVETSAVETAAVDGARLYYNPAFTAKLDKDELDAVMAHEVCHCILRHHERVKGKNHMVWNIAADYAVNELLRDLFRHRLPEPHLYDEQYAGWTAERIYEHLMRNLPKTGVVVPGEAMPGSGGGSNGGSPLPNNGKIQGEVLAPGALEPGGGDGGEGSSPVQDWGKLTAMAAESCRRQGKHVPDSLERTIRNGPTPDNNWIGALERHFTPSRHEVLWKRPDRRFVADGIYLPGRGGERMEHAAFVCDTSGSIRAEELGLFQKAFGQVLRAVMPMEVTLVYADSDVRAVHTWTEGELPIQEWPPVAGGGGTDFRPALRYLAEHGTPPSACVFLTDLWGDFGDKPHYPMLWVGVDSDHEPAPFGETVYMKVR